MVAELPWGLPIVIHLFLVGLGAGALAASAWLLLSGDPRGERFAQARVAAFIAPLPIMADGLVLITELGSFQAGHWFKWLNLYRTITFSPMSIGSWLLVLFIGLSVLYAATFLIKGAAADDRWRRPRRALAWIGLPLALVVGLYPGFLLGALPARPLWNSPVLPLLLLLSGLSAAIACVALAGVRWRGGPGQGDAGRVLVGANLAALGGQVLLLLLFLAFARMAARGAKEALSVILAGGDLALEFWLWAVAVGLVVPIAVGLAAMAASGSATRRWGGEVVMPAAVIVGALMLRYVLVVGGQITGPVGI